MSCMLSTCSARQINHSTKIAFRKFGIGCAQAIGVAIIEFPIESVIKISVHIIDTYLSILLSLADMNAHQVHYDNLENKLYHFSSGHFAKLSRKFDHPFLLWNSINHCLFTGTKLRRLYKGVSHPNANQLYNVFKCSELSEIDSKTHQLFEDITRKCAQCQR